MQFLGTGLTLMMTTALMLLALTAAHEGTVDGCYHGSNDNNCDYDSVVAFSYE